MLDRTDTDYIKPVRTFLLHWLNETVGADVRIVQVGANDGSMADPLSPVIGRFGWGALLIEPVPRYFAALSAKYKGNDKVHLKNFAISMKEGTETIWHLAAEHEEAYPGWARGLASFDREHLQKAIKPDHVTSIEVPCHPLSAILDETGFSNAHVLVVDVEGAEKLVFSSFKWAQFRPMMIEVETRHLPPNIKNWLFNHFHRGGYDVFDFGFDTVAIRRGWLPGSLRHLIALTRLNEFRVAPRKAG